MSHPNPPQHLRATPTRHTTPLSNPLSLVLQEFRHVHGLVPTLRPSTRLLTLSPPHAPRTSPKTRQHHPVPFSTEPPVCLQSFALIGNPQPELYPAPRPPSQPWPNPTNFLKVSHLNFSIAQPFSKGISYLTQTPPSTCVQRQPDTLPHFPTPSLQFCKSSDTFTGSFRR